MKILFAIAFVSLLVACAGKVPDGPVVPKAPEVKAKAGDECPLTDKYGVKSVGRLQPQDGVLTCAPQSNR